MTTDSDKWCWPIIYVRGYAMTRGEIDDTTADPFCGFNLGSTVMRARTDKKEPPKKFIFESPVVRLQSDFGYCDVYEDGVDIVDPDWKGGIAKKSIIIHRYYDDASTFLGSGVTPSIDAFAKELSKLVLSVRDRVCEKEDNEVAEEDFRCYLVAHSMGGLVCRAFLQNEANGDNAARRCVDKFFTYATPHNGIDVAGINVPQWLTKDDISNFNRETMSKYLGIQHLYASKTLPEKRVDWFSEVPGNPDLTIDRVFCMIGTNRTDYEAAAGLSRSFVGHGSDGLVRIDNAALWGVTRVKNKWQATVPAARAYTYRAHSGRYGIVNGEEAYQNLARFLFGDVRVDIWIDIDDVAVPAHPDLEEADEKSKLDDGGSGKLDALYQIELHTSILKKRWFLSRRTAEEDSAACRSHSDLRLRPSERQVYLSTTFLSKAKDAPLAYALNLGIRVPDYEIDKKFWPDQHIEGQYLFRDSLLVQITPPGADGVWTVTSDWQDDKLLPETRPLDTRALEAGKVEVVIPFPADESAPIRRPGVRGKVRFVASLWNVDGSTPHAPPRG